MYSGNNGLIISEFSDGSFPRKSSNYHRHNEYAVPIQNQNWHVDGERNRKSRESSEENYSRRHKKSKKSKRHRSRSRSPSERRYRETDDHFQEYQPRSSSRSQEIYPRSRSITPPRHCFTCTCKSHERREEQKNRNPRPDVYEVPVYIQQMPREVISYQPTSPFYGVGPSQQNPRESVPDVQYSTQRPLVRQDPESNYRVQKEQRNQEPVHYNSIARDRNRTTNEQELVEYPSRRKEAPPEKDYRQMLVNKYPSWKAIDQGKSPLFSSKAPPPMPKSGDNVDFPVNSVSHDVIRYHWLEFVNTSKCHLEWISPNEFDEFEIIRMNGKREDVRETKEMIMNAIVDRKLREIEEDEQAERHNPFVQKILNFYVLIDEVAEESLMGKRMNKLVSIEHRFSNLRIEKLHNCSRCIVTLKGPPESVRTAYELIQSEIDKAFDEESKMTYLDVAVAKNFIGELMGVGGSNLRELQEQTGAQIEFIRATGVFKIRGLPEQVKEAERRIRVVTSRHLPADRDTGIFDLDIPVGKAGKVIGANGKTINRIRKESGAKCVLIEENGTCRMTFSGDVRKAAKARHLAMVELGEAQADEEPAQFGNRAKLTNTQSFELHMQERRRRFAEETKSPENEPEPRVKVEYVDDVDDDVIEIFPIKQEIDY